jgi:hypothetical protein
VLAASELPQGERGGGDPARRRGGARPRRRRSSSTTSPRWTTRRSVAGGRRSTRWRGRRTRSSPRWAFSTPPSHRAVRGGAQGAGARTAVVVLAEAIGSAGLLGGQVADLEATGTRLDLDALEYIHSHKTGALFIAAARARGRRRGRARPRRPRAEELREETWGSRSRSPTTSSTTAGTPTRPERRRARPRPHDLRDLCGIDGARRLVDDLIGASVRRSTRSGSARRPWRGSRRSSASAIGDRAVRRGPPRGSSSAATLKGPIETVRAARDPSGREAPRARSRGRAPRRPFSGHRSWARSSPRRPSPRTGRSSGLGTPSSCGSTSRRSPRRRSSCSTCAAASFVALWSRRRGPVQGDAIRAGSVVRHRSSSTS